MKKILCLAICIVMGVTLLVGCQAKTTEEELNDLITNMGGLPQKEETINLTMFVISGHNGNANDSDAELTVQQNITPYIKNEYNVLLTIRYVSEQDYESRIDAAIQEGKTPNIVLINSEEMYDKYMENGKIAKLTSYLYSNDISLKKYSTMNKDIASVLWDAVAETGSDGTKQYYAVPNDRIVGEYKYLLIDRQLAFDNNYSENAITSITSLEDANLADICAAAGSGEIANDSEGLVRVVNGDYALKAKLEEQGFLCNVIEKPQVTREYAFESAYCIFNNGAKYNNAAMKIIYALNTDAHFRNLLQYGVEGIHYTFDGDVVKFKNGAGDVPYYMNPLYTGDASLLYYCNDTDRDIIWNSELKNEVMKNQNDDAELVVPSSGVAVVGAE